MPTIVIKGRNRTLKLTKRERDILILAGNIAGDIEDDFDALRETANYAKTGILGILQYIDNPPDNGKPQPPEAGK